MDLKEILRLIPQRPPFVMIDDVHTGDTNYTSLKIREDNVLVDKGVLTAAGIVENIAQTAAACMNLNNKTGESAIGYIGSVKNLHLHALPKIGETIRTTVAFLHRIMNAHVVQGKVYDSQDQMIASCNLQIFEQTPGK